MLMLPSSILLAMTAVDEHDLKYISSKAENHD